MSQEHKDQVAAGKKAMDAEYQENYGRLLEAAWAELDALTRMLEHKDNRDPKTGAMLLKTIAGIKQMAATNAMQIQASTRVAMLSSGLGQLSQFIRGAAPAPKEGDPNADILATIGKKIGKMRGGGIGKAAQPAARVSHADPGDEDR